MNMIQKAISWVTCVLQIVVWLVALMVVGAICLSLAIWAAYVFYLLYTGRY